MKKLFIYITLTLAAFSTGCKKDEPLDDDQKVPVSFVVEEEVTRTVLENGTTKFVAGDQIGISSAGLAEEMENATFTVVNTENGLALSGDVFYYNRATSASFYAHYPNSATYNAGKVKMTIGSDQTSAAKYNTNDFMTAIGTGNPKSVADGGTAGAVTLKFNHALALVKVIWNGSTSAYGVDLHNILPEATWTYSDNSYTSSGTAISVSSWKTSDTGQEYWALIPAQSIAASTSFLTVKDLGKNYSYTTQSAITFAAGTVKVITLSLNPDDTIKADISDLSIENWGSSDSASGTVDKNTFDAVTLLDVSNFDYITLNERKNKDAVVEGEWAKVATQGNVEVVKDTTVNASVLAIHAAAESNWYNRCAIWRPSKSLAQSITPTLFKLSIDVKVEDATDAIMVQVMKGDEPTNKYFTIYNADPSLEYAEGKAPNPALTSYSMIRTANQYVTMNFWIDFSTIVSKASSESDPVYETSTSMDFSKVLLVVSSHTLGQRSIGQDDAGQDIMQDIYAYFKNFQFKEQRK